MSNATTTPFPDRIGAHAARVQGDVIHVHFHGEVRPEDAQAIAVLADRVAKEAGDRVFFIANLKDAGPPGPEARRIFAAWRPAFHFITIYYGAVLQQQQTFAMLVDAAMHSLGGKMTRGRFVETEEQALSLLEEERRRTELRKTADAG